MKLKFEPKLAAFTVSRALPLGVTYPFDWGFVPGTLADDGDPIDALVLNEQSSFPGLVVPCRAIAVVLLEQRGENGKRERNDRLIVTPRLEAPIGRWEHVKSLSKPLRSEIELFFLNAVFFTSKDPKILGWAGPRTATELIARAVKMFARARKRKAR